MSLRGGALVHGLYGVNSKLISTKLTAHYITFYLTTDEKVRGSSPPSASITYGAKSPALMAYHVEHATGRE